MKQLILSLLTTDVAIDHQQHKQTTKSIDRYKNIKRERERADDDVEDATTKD